MHLYRYAAVILLFAVTATAQDDPAALAASAGCGACHQAEKAMMGPSWQAVADRYSDEESVLATLQDRMRAGSQGRWGKPPMQPVTPEQLTDHELSAVLEWILSR